MQPIHTSTPPAQVLGRPETQGTCNHTDAGTYGVVRTTVAGLLSISTAHLGGEEGVLLVLRGRHVLHTVAAKG